MSFSDLFADNIDPLLFNSLGDDVTVINSDGETVIKCEFMNLYDDDELINRVDTIHPAIEIKETDGYLFVKGSKIRFNNKVYLFLRKQPKEAHTLECIFRQVKVI